jgi:hypothetical protein
VRASLSVRTLACLLPLLAGPCAAAGQTATQAAPNAASQTQQPVAANTLQRRAAVVSGTPAAASVVMIHSRAYLPPTQHQLFQAYLRDSYGWPALASSTVRTLYGEARANNPSAYGTDAAGFGQRLGSNLAITAITGNVRFAMEEVFHEDLRYIPCHGCSVKHKIENALLAEITARHDRDGHRFFTLTPTISDFSGPLIAHSTWYPGASEGPIRGVISARTVFAVRIGGHLFREFVLERRHKDAPEPR